MFFHDFLKIFSKHVAINEPLQHFRVLPTDFRISGIFTKFYKKVARKVKNTKIDKKLLSDFREHDAERLFRQDMRPILFNEDPHHATCLCALHSRPRDGNTPPV